MPKARPSIFRNDGVLSGVEKVEDCGLDASRRCMKGAWLMILDEGAAAPNLAQRSELQPTSHRRTGIGRGTKEMSSNVTQEDELSISP